MAAAKGNVEILELMLKNKALDIQIKEHKTGLNAFWIACFFGHGHFMKVLAENGIDVLVANHQGINSLHLACLLGFKEIVKMLIYSDFPLDKRCDLGMTALHIAAYNDNLEIVKIIIEYAKTKSPRFLKRTINMLNRQHTLSALGYSIITDATQTSHYLVQNKAMIYYHKSDLEKDMSPIFLCIIKQDLQLLEVMYNNY